MPPTTHLILVVALGGSAGALARFAIHEGARRWGFADLHWATMLINIIGCLILGLLLGWAAKRGDLSELWRHFLMVGVLGGFTTFSAYSGESLRLIQQGRTPEALVYLALSVALGLGACAAGFELSARLAT